MGRGYLAYLQNAGADWYRQATWLHGIRQLSLNDRHTILSEVRRGVYLSHAIRTAFGVPPLPG